jgi:hypothetical protein
MAESQYNADSAVFSYFPLRSFNEPSASLELNFPRGSTQKGQPKARVPSAWIFRSRDVTPLAWWRCLPADLLGEPEHLEIHRLIGKIGVLKGREWVSAMRGDAAASIAIAIAALPISTITLEVDLAMTALVLVALNGDAAAALVLSHVLRRTSLEHPFSAELSASWLEFNLRRAMGTTMVKARSQSGSGHTRKAETQTIGVGA